MRDLGLQGAVRGRRFKTTVPDATAARPPGPARSGVPSEAGHRRGEIDTLRGPANPRQPDQQPHPVQQHPSRVVRRRQPPAQLVNHGVEHGHRQIGGLHLVEQSLRLGRKPPGRVPVLPDGFERPARSGELVVERIGVLDRLARRVEVLQQRLER